MYDSNKLTNLKSQRISNHLLSSPFHTKQETENMGAIVSRKKRTVFSNSQPALTSQTTAHAETTPSEPENQAHRHDTQLPDLGSHDDENDQSDESDKSESEPESNDGENHTDHDSVRSFSASSESNRSVKESSSTVEVSETKPMIDGAPSEEEFTKVWRKALLEDLNINIADNVKIVRIFTSSTFTGKLEKLPLSVD